MAFQSSQEQGFQETKAEAARLPMNYSQNSCGITSDTFDWSIASQVQLIFKRKYNKLHVLKEYKQDHITKAHAVGDTVVAIFGHRI